MRKPFEPLDEMGDLIDYHRPLVLMHEANAAIESDREHYEHVHSKWIERNTELRTERDVLKTENEKLRANFKFPTLLSLQGEITQMKVERELIDAHRDALKAQLAEAEQVVEFYANTQNYDVETGAIHDMAPRGMSKPQKLWKVLDIGERARAYLAK